MVFGFGEGKMDIKLEKTSFAPGEAIRGKVWLKVNSPKKAKRVYLELRAMQRVRRTEYSSRGNKTVYKDETVFSFIQDLDVEKEYVGEVEYPFEIRAPTPSTPLASGALDAALQVASLFTPQNRGSVRWYLRAALDIPMGFDINKEVQINIV